MKKMKLELRKETIEVLDRSRQNDVLGGGEVVTEVDPTNLSANDCTDFAQSRITCFTVTKWEWDCGGSIT